jgi:hypothetical protein
VSAQSNSGDVMLFEIIVTVFHMGYPAGAMRSEGESEGNPEQTKQV